MTQVITRLFDSHADAIRAVDELERAGVGHDRISIVSNNAENWHGGDRGEVTGARALGDRDADGDNDTAEGAGKGAAIGGVLGGGAGLLAGLGMLAIPGLGPVVAAGWLVSTALGAAAGAAAGGATGGLLGALKDAGHTDDEANVYSEGVRRGGTLVSVRADREEAARIQQILDSQRGADATARGADYRATGWSRFDPKAQPYTADEIAAERRRYHESRSFAAGEVRDEDAAIEADTRPAGAPFSQPAPGSDA